MTPGYHRYMRNVWFVSGMAFSMIWASWYLVAIAVLLVIGRGVYDIIQEERDNAKAGSGVPLEHK